MTITPVEHGMDLAASVGEPRTEGIHMSDLYNDLYAKLEPKRYGRGGPMPMEKFELGMTWETVLEEGLKKRLAISTESGRPGEFVTSEGIIYTPDLLIFNRHTKVGEIKLTFMSTKGAPWKLGETYTGFDPKFNKWMTQVKCYCHALGTQHARLYVFFVRGDYTSNDQIFRAWDLEFTKRELKEEYDWVLNHGRKEMGLKI